MVLILFQLATSSGRSLFWGMILVYVNPKKLGVYFNSALGAQRIRKGEGYTKHTLIRSYSPLSHHIPLIRFIKSP